MGPWGNDQVIGVNSIWVHKIPESSTASSTRGHREKSATQRTLLIVLVPRSQTSSLRTIEKYISAVHNPIQSMVFWLRPSRQTKTHMSVCVTFTTVLWNKYHYHHPSLFWWGNWGTKNSRNGACHTACKSQSQDSCLLEPGARVFIVHCWCSLAEFGFFYICAPRVLCASVVNVVSVSVIGIFFKVIYF